MPRHNGTTPRQTKAAKRRANKLRQKARERAEEKDQKATS